MKIQILPVILDSMKNYKSKQNDCSGVMVIIVGNGHGNMSSNPGQDWLHFT